MSKRAVQTKFRRLKAELRSLLGRYPRIFLPLCRLRAKYRSRVVDKQTELVIEGYPRSANTFAVAAFMLAQERPVRIAHHLHVPAQVIQAVKWNIPTLVLIRKPEDAVLSRIIRKPFISIEFALRDYIRFYESIRELGDGYVLATFDEAIHDLGNVIRRVNYRFGCDFRVFEHTPSNVERVFRMVEQMDLRDTGKNTVCEETVARPSRDRERKKSQLKEKLLSYAELLERATSLYRELTGAF